MINEYIEKTLTGTNDSDRHLLVLFSIALATKGKNFIELGVRSGTTTTPLKIAAKLNGAKLHSVDIDTNPFKIKKDDNWEFHQSDAVEFLLNWELLKKPTPDFIYIDDVVNLILRSLKMNFSGTLNVVTGNSYSFNEVAEKCRDIFSPQTKTIKMNKNLTNNN
jgi:hypothetical protein